MKICHLSVKNFRGIKELDWFIERDINCLVGSGDSTKSTILAAIYYAFLPTWNPIFRDSDFFNQDTDQQIEIIATIRDFPPAIHSKYSQYLRGLRNNEIVDEPEDTDVPVLSLRLAIDSNLEATWTVFTEREFSIPQTISAADRRALGVFRLGGVYDGDFSWTKGSALSRLSDQENTVRLAIRSLRSVDTFDSTSELQRVASEVETVVASMGVSPSSQFRPAIDSMALEDNRGVISVQDGEVPLRMKGKGTKRLIAMGMQKKLTNKSGVLTIDEIESGLEPYRLRHLIREIQDSIQKHQTSQVFATTHSDVAVVEFDVAEIARVSCDSAGKVSITNLPNDSKTQKLIRSHPEAVLSKKMIVCEGRTEYGFCLGLERYWCAHNHDFFTLFGTAPTEVRGVDEAAKQGEELKKIGYEIALFIDGDVQPGIGVDELRRRGLTVHQWSSGQCTETIVFTNIDADNFRNLIKMAFELQSSEKILSDLSKSMNDQQSTNTPPASEQEFMAMTVNEDLRSWVGKAAKDGAWYKTWDGGIALGYYVARSLPNIQNTPLHNTVTQLLNWAKQ